MAKSKYSPQTRVDVKGDTQWDRPKRLPLADTLYIRPAYADSITELNKTRTGALKRWLRVSGTTDSVLVIHRNACNIARYNLDEQSACSCAPTYLVTGARA